MKLSFIIPCYRSENTLSIVVETIRELMTEHMEYDYEIILINDCSPDHVGDVIYKMAESDPRIKGIELAKNFGQHAATMAGYRSCTGDIVVTLDDDGESPVKDTFKLIDIILEGEDIVQARYQEENKSIFRKLGSKMNNWMMSALIGKPKDLVISNFSAMRRFIIDEICKYNTPYTYIAGMFFNTTKHIANVDLERPPRLSGKSGYSLKKLLNLWFNGILSYSAKPLRISIFLGFICSTLGFLYGIITIIRYFVIPNIQSGYSSLLSVILFISGIFMIELGMVGEYVGRSYITLNNLPQYVIRSTVNIQRIEK
ncbi:MAG: glycosyltransferase family 2 protein [Eubacteriales bacterium]|nr:glycosyltransferase family 2 protein [Eubacteriales bacterium]